MRDLPQRLRDVAGAQQDCIDHHEHGHYVPEVLIEAANEIERLLSWKKNAEAELAKRKGER